jgi:hypothetical protein
MGAKRKAAKTAPKRATAPKKATAKKVTTKKATPKKAAAPKNAAAPKKAAAAKKATPRKKATPQQPRAVTRSLSPEDLAARIAATGLVPTAYLLPWEPIHGPGDYAAIARALSGLTEGAFPLEDVTETLDPDQKEGTLELKLDGVRHMVTFQVRDAELDESVLVVLGAFFERRQERVPSAERRGLFIDASTCRKAHTHLLISATYEAMAAINAATGAAFMRLTEL